jgi:hypothetical protein
MAGQPRQLRALQTWHGAVPLVAPDRQGDRGVDESDTVCLQACGKSAKNTLHLRGPGGGDSSVSLHMGAPRSISRLSTAVLHGTQARSSD